MLKPIAFYFLPVGEGKVEQGHQPVISTANGRFLGHVRVVIGLQLDDAVKQAQPGEIFLNTVE